MSRLVFHSMIQVAGFQLLLCIIGALLFGWPGAATGLFMGPHLFIIIGDYMMSRRTKKEIHDTIDKIQERK